MNVEEAKAAIGYEFTATVFSDIRAGRLKLDRTGAITEASVRKRIDARAASAARSRKFKAANPDT